MQLHLTQLRAEMNATNLLVALQKDDFQTIFALKDSYQSHVKGIQRQQPKILWEKMTKEFFEEQKHIYPRGEHWEDVLLMTRDNLRDLPEPVTKPGRVAVYFPMSYQFGGATVFVPREWVHPTNLSVEAAMRAIITAWLPGHDKKLEGL